MVVIQPESIVHLMIMNNLSHFKRGLITDGAVGWNTKALNWSGPCQHLKATLGLVPSVYLDMLLHSSAFLLPILCVLTTNAAVERINPQNANDQTHGQIFFSKGWKSQGNSMILSNPTAGETFHYSFKGVCRRKIGCKGTNCDHT